MDDPPPSLARGLRIAAVVFVVAWFFVPGLRNWIPLWLPFLALAAFELHYVVTGLRDRGAARGPRGRTPQAEDIDELGGEEWLEPVLVQVDGRDVWLPAAGEEDAGGLAEEPDDDEPELPARRGRSRLGGLIIVAALGVAAFVFVPDRGWDGLDDGERARAEALFSAEAARIAGHAADLRCDAEGEAVGVVQHADGLAEVGGTIAYLTPEICHTLHRVAFADDDGSFSQTARALAVLAHEAWHLRGVANEGVANCYAFQSGVELGRRLGLADATAARMMRQQLVENAGVARRSPEYLVPGECRDGGSLDLDPAGSRFP